MKKTNIVLTLILSVNFFYPVITYSQSKNKAAVIQIEKYIKKVDQTTKTKKEPDLVFADVSQNNKPKWRKFSSTRSLGKYREEKSETYSISNNWVNNGKIVVSIFTIFSESGDWANYVSYYYRQSGSLAKIELEYKTFNGNFAVIKNIFFSSKGKILTSNIKYVDLDNKPMKPDKEYVRENSSVMNDFGYYKTTAKLPFYYLLKSR